MMELKRDSRVSRQHGITQAQEEQAEREVIWIVSRIHGLENVVRQRGRTGQHRWLGAREVTSNYYLIFNLNLHHHLFFHTATLVSLEHNDVLLKILPPTFHHRDPWGNFI